MTSRIHEKTILLVSSIILGIFIEEYYVYTSELLIVISLIILVLGVIAYIERKSLQKKMADTVDVCHFSFTTFLLIFMLGVLIGILRSQFIETKNSLVCEKSCTARGMIVSDPVVRSKEQVIYVRPENSANTFYDIKVVTNLYPKYVRGESVTLTGNIERLENFSDTQNNSHFDYKKFMTANGVGSSMYFPKIEIDEEGRGGVILKLQSIKNFVNKKLHSSVSEPASYIAVGTLLGVSEIPDDIRESFRVSGLSHILVLSGFNIVIVISSILFIFRFLPLILRLLFASLGTILFVLMVGATPSVVRATIMALIALFAYGVGRTYVARQALLLSLLFVIIYDPQLLLFDVSLHLSFLATAGLVYLSQPIESLLAGVTFLKDRKFLRELIVTTLAAYTITLPYVMYMFGSVSVYALLANILIVPLVPTVMFMSFFTVIMSLISETIAYVFGYVDTLFIDLIISVVTTMQRLPFSTISISLSFVQMVLLYVVVILFVKYKKVSWDNETQRTEEDGKITQIISY